MKFKWMKNKEKPKINFKLDLINELRKDCWEIKNPIQYINPTSTPITKSPPIIEKMSAFFLSFIRLVGSKRNIW